MLINMAIIIIFRTDIISFVYLFINCLFFLSNECRIVCNIHWDILYFIIQCLL